MDHGATMWQDTDLASWRRAGAVTASVTVADVMTWPAVVLKPDKSVAFALEIAADYGIEHFPIAQRGDLVGIVCTCDLRRAPATAPVAAHMTRRVLTASPHLPLSQAAARMDDRDVGCLPVPFHDAWGIVTRGDLVRAGACTRRRCLTCRDPHHVRRHPHYEEVWMCLDCLEDDEDDLVRSYYRDLGGGD